MSKGGVALLLGEILLFPDDVDCDPGWFNRRANKAFVATAEALRDAARAFPGFYPDLRVAIDAQTVELKNLRDAAYENMSDREDPDEKCDPPFVLGAAVSEALLVALEQATDHLNLLHRMDAITKASRTKSRQKPVGFKTCDEADDLRRMLGAGSGRANHVVYWSPTPTEGLVRYVGRSRSLWTRCKAHPKTRRDALRTLNLPPLTRDEARNVEEALIAHFGTPKDDPNEGYEERVPQLVNKRHEHNPDGRNYCDHLLNGQFILMLGDGDGDRQSHYWEYRKAYFTRNVGCPGTGDKLP